MTDDRVWCEGTQHRVEVDVVTFIFQPDEVFRKFVVGTADEVKQQLREIRATKSPNADMFVAYCCDKCKEEENG